MAKHARVQTAEQRERLTRNRNLLLSVLSGAAKQTDDSIQTAGLSLALERFAINRANGRTVPYEGGFGMESILRELSQTYRGDVVDGHLVGLDGILTIEGAEAPIEVRASLGIGSQLRLEVGPAASVTTLLDAIRVFDRHFHLACKTLGLDLELLARGCNPEPSSPSDIVPVPLSRNVLINAHYSRTGRYAREAMRCTAGTDVLLSVNADANEATADYRLATALAPLLAFATDNSLTMRDSDPYQTPRMLRALVCHDLDASRTGLPPETFQPGFGFEAYLRWVEETQPIYFTSANGVTFSTGSDTGARVMEERDLSEPEARRLLQSVLPDVRWNGRLELRMADSLPIHLAAAYAALIKGLYASPQTKAAVGELLGINRLDRVMVMHAWDELRALGWDARIYDRPVGQIIHELASIASHALDVRDERRMLDGLAQLWDVRYVPRDTLLRNWERTRERSSEEVAVELYGEGAVIPYDELGGEPPAGQTATLPIIR